MSNTGWSPDQMPPPDPRWQDNPEPWPTMPREQIPRRGGSLHRVGILGHFASLLMAVVAVASAFYAWTQWNSLRVIEDFVARPFAFTEEQALARLEAADNLTRISVWLYGVLFVAAAVVFIIWLWRARNNAEVLSDRQHTRARGWAIGGWFVPIVSWWFPYQVVRDVYLAADPATRATSGELRFARGGRLVGLWWTCWVVFSVAAIMSVRHTRNEPGADATVGEFVRWFRQGTVYDTVSTVFEVLAVVLIFLVIRRISRWQEAAVEGARAGLPPAQ